MADMQFFPMNQSEHSKAHSGGISPKHISYECGACAKSTNGRVLCQTIREIDGGKVLWCICACEKAEPTTIIERGDIMVGQLPEAREFEVGDKWPADLSKLFDEASKSFAAGAYTATTMLARKILMVCSCQEGETDGKPFADYVTHITANVLTFERAKEPIDAIRKIGNDANHNVQFVTRDNAKRALSIIKYMLDAIYSLPGA